MQAIPFISSLCPIMAIVILRISSKNNKRVILINNGIHPGEPDAVDACMLLARHKVFRTEEDPPLPGWVN